jgi:uncharacterized protein
MNKKRLIIFTRYPEIGKNKTRMISLLGAKGATELHRQMTEYTLNKFKPLQKQEDTEIIIYFTGGNEILMKQWLGENLIYKPQKEGDLGNKMESAFMDAFKDKINQVILIGIDCPEITREIIQKGFNLLSLNRDLVLGKAKDGGYYLIGLNKPISPIFNNILWGTSQVLNQTIDRAKKLNLNYDLLPELSDIDRPEDLPIWKNIIE